MLKVVICCGAGMSSSYLCQKLQNETKARGLENEVSFDFFSMGLVRTGAHKTVNQYDVAMCCPHLKVEIKNMLKEVEQAGEELTCALYMLPPKIYGTLPFDEVLQDAKDVYAEWKETKAVPFFFPGEEWTLGIKRGVAYRNWNKDYQPKGE